MSLLDVRPVVEGDISALIALYSHLTGDTPAMPSDMAARRFTEIDRHPGMTILAGFAGSEMASSCTLVVIPNLTRGGRPYALIENVVTHPDHRRMGYGRAVIRKAIEMAFQADCYKVMLLTGARNPGVIEFYESCGFSQSKTGFQIRQD
ncbi:GNAT family N-acetyltransferase [Rhizobium sp. PAMB 3174]